MLSWLICIAFDHIRLSTFYLSIYLSRETKYTSLSFLKDGITIHWAYDVWARSTLDFLCRWKCPVFSSWSHLALMALTLSRFFHLTANDQTQESPKETHGREFRSQFCLRLFSVTICDDLYTVHVCQQTPPKREAEEPNETKSSSSEVGCLIIPVRGSSQLFSCQKLKNKKVEA